MIIDDDPVSLQLLGLQLQAAGHSVLSASTGVEALAVAADLNTASKPDAVLADMRMPGLNGEALASELRRALGPDALLVAMSASIVTAPAGYHGFLRKPLRIEELQGQLEGLGAAPLASDTGELPVLKRETFRKLKVMMPWEAVLELYSACLSDTRTRIETMQAAASSGDHSGLLLSAHTVKGSAGMIGAMQLAEIAEEIEMGRIAPEELPGVFSRMIVACNELERMLDGEQRNEASDDQ